MEHISIIVVHFNQEKYTRQCLESLSRVKHSHYDLTIVVVDNGSTEPFVLPKRYDTDTFLLIRSDANLGFTGGNNLGIHTAIERFNSAYVLLLNNDTTVDPSFVDNLVKFSQADQLIGIVAPMIYFAPGREFHRSSYSADQRGKVIWYAGGSIDWNHVAMFHRGVDEVDRGQFDTQLSSDFATGCCMMIKREVLEKIGFLDKRFFMYGEDVDFCLRASEEGYRIGFCSPAKVWHFNAGSSGGSGSSLQQYYQERNRHLLAFRHGSWQSKWASARLQLQALLSSSPEKQKAVVHLYQGKFGKQPLW